MIVLCGALVPKDTVTGPPMVRPVVLADGKWSQSNESKGFYCSADVAKLIVGNPMVDPEQAAQYFADAKELYWRCVTEIGGAL